MEQENQHQIMILHDNIEQEVDDDFALEKTLPPHVVVTSSSTSSSDSIKNGGSHHNNGTSSIVTNPDESCLQKEEEDEEKDNVGECNSGFGDDKEEDCVPVGVGLVAEFVEEEEATKEEVITDSTFGSESSDILQNKNSVVYFDNQEGVWKCHHCTWSTKRFGSPSTVFNWNLKGYREMPMNVNTLIQHGPCFVRETNKANEVNGLNRDQNGDATNHEKSKFDEEVENSAIQNSLSSEVDNQHMRIVNDKIPSDSELSASPDTSVKQVTTPAANSREETKKQSNSINEIDQQEKEFDVELVIAKQETHDLYCPNCKSCITKRVILKKRKRSIHVLDNKGKPDRLDPVVDDNVAISTTTHEVNQGDYANVISEITTVEEPPAVAAASAAAAVDDDDHPEKEVEVFRCLSCFSIFIPSGNGFNLFRNFGGASKQESSQNPSSITESNLQNPSNISSSNQNWFISLFTSTKGKTATEQGDASREPSRTGPADLHQSTITSTIPSSPDISHPEGPVAEAVPIKNPKPTSDVNHGHGMVNSTISSNGGQNDVQDFIDFSEKEQSLTRKPRTDNREKNQTSVDTIKTNTVEVTSSKNYSNGTVSEYKSVNSVTTTSSETFSSSRETTKGAVVNHYQEKPEFIIPTSVIVGSLLVDNSPNDVNKTPEIVKNNDSSLKQGGAQPPVQSFDSTISAIDAMFPSKTDISLIEKMRQDIDKANPSIRKENKGDVIVVVDGEVIESATSQTDNNVPVDGANVTGSQTQVGVVEQPRNEIGEPKKWEIVKSIVYGGLVESITSLGIVSSAASSGATPLNIIALGFANLIGGLFILGHNLKELKDSHTRGQQLQTNVQNQYQELLGNRSNFVFHAVIAVLSFLIFGSVPLVIYSVLINKNYYDEVKLAIVAASSVACIILLTIGKVYTKRPPKSYIKTVSYYVTMALAVSGLSYIAGKLIKDLIDKFSQSESGFSIRMPISDTSVETAWMSY